MANESEPLGQDEIEALLRESQAAKAPDAAKDSPAAPAAVAPAAASEGSQVLGQEDIEALLSQARGGAKPAVAAPKKAAPAAPAASEESMTPGDIEYLLQQAEAALASVDEPRAEPLPGAAPFKWEEFSAAPASTEHATLELIRDVELEVKIELGRTQMYLEDVLKLRRGSVVPLDKLAGDPVDLYVNGRLVARGEVLVLNDNFCVRVNELIAGHQARAG
jgi:flagellar motor switch protein FliN/FliY